MERWIIAAVAGGLVLFGFIFWACSRYVARMVGKRKQNCTAAAQAMVTGMNEERRRLADGDYQTFYHPVYEYQAGGETISVQSYVGLEKNRFQVGQTVSLMYNPANPQEYYCEAEKVTRICKIFNIVSYSVWASALGLLVVDLFVL